MTDWATVAIAGSRKQDKAEVVQTVTVPSAALAAGAWRTDVTITGSGYLHAVWLESTYSSEARITVDGGTPVIRSSDLGKIRFKQSLVVEVHNTHTASQSVGSATTVSLDA